jgi:hypothetical protein
METQYYTPTAEDFYVGFECEFKNGMQSNKWEVVICDQDMVSIAYDAVEHSENFKEEFRVKCLDKQDIIDLGWHDNLFLDKDGYIYRIEHINRKVLIYKIMTAAHKQDMVLFLGNIKNKSELKRIMQMLKIIE